jgi:predicted type IV restriction endonuclease
MSLPEKLKALAERVRRREGVLDTEEATKNALVMPFLAALEIDE